MAPGDHRHPSQEIDTDRVRKDAVKDYVITQLTTTMDEVKSGLSAINTQLVHSSLQMDGLGKEVKQLRTDFKEHCAEDTKTKNEARSRWANLVPGLVASISSSLITSAIIGGLVMYYSKK
jgi:hypothetical protein